VGEGGVGEWDSAHKNAYEMAKAGKLQGGTYKNYLHRPTKELKSRKIYLKVF
jgi:hypothetical protein